MVRRDALLEIVEPAAIDPVLAARVSPRVPYPGRLEQHAKPLDQPAGCFGESLMNSGVEGGLVRCLVNDRGRRASPIIRVAMTVARIVEHDAVCDWRIVAEQARWCCCPDGGSGPDEALLVGPDNRDQW